MTQEDIFLYLVPSWHKKGTQLKGLNWPDKQVFIKEMKNLVPSSGKKVPSSGKKSAKLLIEKDIDYQGIIKEEIKKVPGWSEKGTKLLSKRSMYLLTILCLTLEPIRREEIMELMNYGNRKSFNDLYLKPLLQNQFIKRTVEEKPRASTQQYLLTETGKSFLGGLIQ